MKPGTLYSCPCCPSGNNLHTLVEIKGDTCDLSSPGYRDPTTVDIKYYGEYPEPRGFDFYTDIFVE